MRPAIGTGHAWLDQWRSIDTKSILYHHHVPTPGSAQRRRIRFAPPALIASRQMDTPSTISVPIEARYQYHINSRFRSQAEYYTSGWRSRSSDLQ